MQHKTQKAILTSLGESLMHVSDLMRGSFFCKKAKTDVRGKIPQGRIVRLRSGKKDSVPFSKYLTLTRS